MRSEPATRVIAVAGFMGAGKTTVARALARRLACAAVDLDELITTREGRTPQAIIDAEGEPRFRELETRALRALLERAPPLVVALGGGTWALGRNRALLNARRVFTVWLDAPFELCWRRIESDSAARPLARSRESARALYDARRKLYALADLRVAVDEHKTPESLADEIARAAPPC